MKNAENPNNRERYIMLYADEFDEDVWCDYCSALNIDSRSYMVRINFDLKDVVRW